ncbi:cationic amino acid transporter [Acidisarcina polymorpha]|uniref:Cationic amino acid transporter n=1 Tax=Acidisarcina polymorpha TaxID=2211140 RepID=A0A2Z5FVJ2_9BACT|nr:APC family permease [Acidisarcina polymorpha]AXC10772.1 cationic amino acid transporter [Acidisarcina polymorpha]
MAKFTNSPADATANPSPAAPKLARQVSFGSALSLNMMNMIGVGPFITLPLVVIAMGGPQAMLGWVLGAVIAICDGLVWAELGAMMPQAGGSYAYLREMYGRDRAGRLASFLYVWQMGFSAPLSIASGCIGLAQYAAYLWSPLANRVFSHSNLPWLGDLRYTSLAAAATCAVTVALLYRNVRSITRLAWILWAGVLITITSVIVAGFTHFHSAQAFSFPSGAFHPGHVFFSGLGAATLIATYDYWGYYNVAFLGGEIREPGRAIPRAILISIFIVAVLYLLMNVSVLGVIPWQEMNSSINTQGRFAVVALVMQRTFGATAARIIALLVMWTAFASVFALLLGYSRVPYAAALDGNYFKIFARLHPREAFPNVSLLALGTVATFFCFFDLSNVIAALVAIRIILQFLLQHVGVILLRIREPDRDRPFRMWLYPLPPVLAGIGFLFILISRPNASRELRYGAMIAISGLLIYFVRARYRREWPFAKQAQT